MRTNAMVSVVNARMPTRCLCLFLTGIFFSLAILTYNASAHTDLLDVQALQDLYTTLDSSSQLKSWKSDGGDPCEESWTGVYCNGSSVSHIILPGLALSGYLGSQLFNLHNLKQLDISSNNIHGEIPASLPLNITHLNLASNNFSKSIPYSLTSMKNLRHLNLSHNMLSGPIGNVFTGLTYLKEMDLSYNNFTGDLPSSFGSLTSLTRLYLQSNEFSGSVVFLAPLQLNDLNIEDNHFSGFIPTQFQSIQNLWIGGNKFDQGNQPAWYFPFDTITDEKNLTSPPTTESSAIETNHHPSHKFQKHKKSLGPGGIAVMVGGVALIATCAALIIAVRVHQSRAQILTHLGSSQLSHVSIRSNNSSRGDLAHVRSKLLRVSRNSFSKMCSIQPGLKIYTVAEIQSASHGFSKSNLLGDGSLGSVYKAEFPDGQIVAVKNINTVTLSFNEEEQFLETIWNAARLRHQNIVTLIGYCVEFGQHLIVYEYVTNCLSLSDALHGESVTTPLSWRQRLGISLGVARALDYLHSTCNPPVAHNSLKASNVLLDEDCLPRLCDCGLAVLKPLTSNSVKLKASEMAISDTGYIAPEFVEPGVVNTMGDVYAFGVLLLEIFTGRRPFDSSRPIEEQSLVNWASCQLRENGSLEQIVDPTINGSIPSKVLSTLGNIIFLCIQNKKECRPPISEVTESLMGLLQDTHKNKRGYSSDGSEVVDNLDQMSFRSTNSRFFASPSLSYFSV